MLFVLTSLDEQDGQSSHHDAYHRHELNKDVERRSAGVFEGVANCVANDSSFMGKRTFTTKIAFLNHFLGIVPCTSGISHKDGKRETASQTADQQSEYTCYTQYDADNDGNGNCLWDKERIPRDITECENFMGNEDTGCLDEDLGYDQDEPWY